MLDLKIYRKQEIKRKTLRPKRTQAEANWFLNSENKKLLIR